MKFFGKFDLFYILGFLSSILFSTGQGNTVQVIYIKPNWVTVPCPDHSLPCFTLSQFANRVNEILESGQSIELILLPGEHDLEYNIIVENVADFFIHSSSMFEDSQITCRVNETRFEFKLIGRVWISGLKFVGCGNNTVLFVDSLTIEHTIFLGQSESGKALMIYETNIDLQNTTFQSNVVGTPLQIFNTASSFYFVGGAIFAIHSNIIVRDSKFVKNRARNHGGAIYTISQCNITLINTVFTDNSVCVDFYTCFGGAICHEILSQTPHRSWLMIYNSTFSHNRAFKGAVFATQKASVDINFSHFYSNHSPFNGSQNIGEIVYLGGETHLKTNGSLFNNNTAATVIRIENSATLTDSQFLNNKGYIGSVLHIAVIGASLMMRGCHFSNNTAIHGGTLHAEQCNITIDECSFDENYVKAEPNLITFNTLPEGGVMTSEHSYITISKTTFTSNRADDGFAGVVALFGNVTMIVDSCSFLANQARQGGAINAQQSTILFRGTNTFMSNSATQYGGGIYTGGNSIVNLNDELLISNNTAGNSGGGMYLYQSLLKCDHNCNVLYKHNMATINGGGVYVDSSIISMSVERESIIFPSIHCIKNTAQYGGGMYLDLSAKIQIIKSGDWFTRLQHTLYFAFNQADYGGAMFVYDEMYFRTCIFNTECFLQVLTTTKPFNHVNGTDTVVFVGNSASTAGSVLFGGLLDRCKVSVNSEIVVENSGASIDGLTFFRNVSIMDENKGNLISSKPIRVCLCSNGQPDCSVTPSTIEVRKGENFTVSVVAVDQVNIPFANSTIYAQLNYTSESGLGVGQLAQVTRKICSNLAFSIVSTLHSEQLILYADGPCRNAGNSVLKQNIAFKECTCPVGFRPRPLEIDNNCMCDCDPQLLPYVTSCDPQTHTLTRRGNSWISYLNITNDTNQYSYLTHTYCPLDYCLSPDTNVEINLNDVQDGSDVQCQNNRSGLLCGVCHPGLSVSLGTSHCISCDKSHDLWWLILIFITAGVALVTVLLVLNMTVVIGTINGIIFYANVIGATSSTFFPTSSTKPTYVIVSWLNLDLGFDACFVDGLDTYMKTWIQMAFPTYIIFLLIIMIVWSERSLKLARLIGRQNPVALLATLIFLSYAKFLSTIIAALLFITLEYPDGYKTVWLPDASVEYLSVKHLVLVVVAIVILLVGSVYTILLLFWQWIRKFAAGKINHKVCHFFDIYQAPYKLKHRYWPGLLLLARVTLYLLFAFNQSGDPRVNLIGIIIVMCSFLLLKGACGCVYKNRVIDFLEYTCYVNVTMFSAVQLYTLQSGKPQTIGAFLSVSITAALLVMVVSYHMYTAVVLKLWQKYKSKNEHDRSDPVTQNSPRDNEMRPYYFHDSIETNSVPTSIVEFPSTESLNAGNTNDDDQNEVVNSASEDSICDNADDSTPLLN